jgi:nucleotide-binding universal stress UspA family protein
MDIKRVRLLVVMDGSEASERVLRYVTRVVGGRRNFRVCLLHVLQPLPPALLEFGGAQRPGEEEPLEAALRQRQREWIVATKDAARPALYRAHGILRKAGLAPGRLAAKFLDPLERGHIVEEILTQARRRRCRGIVVGRESMSWLRELMDGDLAHELVRAAKGFTLWVVE